MTSFETPPLSLERYHADLATLDPLRWRGVVTDVTGLVIESLGPASAIGGFCEIQTARGRRVRTQVAGFRNGRILSIPLEEIDGLEPGDAIYARAEDARVNVGPDLLGRVLDGFGRPMDGGPPIEAEAKYDLFRTPPGPLEREHITQPLVTGIRAIDSLLPCGMGQRIGLFGGSGVGKSTLLGAMSRQNSADVTVVALIGERNREVRHFLENELGEEARKRTVVVAATSDRPAPLRVRACFVALAIAEYFRDQGKNVLLVADSITRLAMAQREIGLRGGRAAQSKGLYPVRVRHSAQDVRAGGKLPQGQHHRLLHRVSRRRRHERADCRRGARTAGRARRAVAAAGRLRSLSGDRRFEFDLARGFANRNARAAQSRGQAARGARLLSPFRRSAAIRGLRFRLERQARCEYPRARAHPAFSAAGLA